jgi:serine/threonine-protein kinase HipA
LNDLVENEFLTTVAARALMPDDKTAELTIAKLDGVHERALLVRRFDRLPSGAKLHFEEFNQLFGRRSGDDKYDAAYEDMASFILKTSGCTEVDAWRLYRRILMCFLTGNTDAHLKNFAMLHTPDGLRLTPSYDLVAAALYKEYQTLALSVGGAANLRIADLKPGHLIRLGEKSGLSAEVIGKVIEEFGRRRSAAEKTVTAAAKKIGAESLGTELLEFMERRWNGTFSLTGKHLSKKLSGGGTK